MLSMLVLSYMPIFFKLGSTIAQSEAHKANLQVELLMLPAPSSISIAPSASGGVRVNDSAGAGVPDGVNDTLVLSSTWYTLYYYRYNNGSSSSYSC